ncbi:MAG: 16S rRNA (cytosine(1402)-N(4))-methyltransferase RsmH [Microbacteriaceae bacterium]|nr:16S rRNA (cytosine(1402)-N(4))-methyltransferase RsmH [Microbacteriaceae bacterium]
MAGLDSQPTSLEEIHLPVMLERTIELLSPALSMPGAIMLDATLGMAGHSVEILRRFPELRVIGIDRDQDALAVARERLNEFESRVRLVKGTFDEIPRILEGAGLEFVSGVLFDFGVSSLQLDSRERGFSYARSSALDMRMDQASGLTARQILAEYDESELRRIFWEYGEERFAGRLAARIVNQRQTEPISDSTQLVALIERVIPASKRRSGHPAKRVFQALRIEVNGELDQIERALPAAIAAIGIGGRIVTLSYHSLEDRAVKRAFAAGASSSSPADLPIELPGHGPVLRLLTRGAELADEPERAANPRSASVRLRAVERIGAAA